MSKAQAENATTRKEREKRQARATHAPDLPPLLSLQRSVGNAAVVQMLRQAGHVAAQDRHEHDAGCGHKPVQRSSNDAVVARAVTEDEQVEDTSPERQSALLDAALKSPSQALPSSVVAKAGAFFQNDRLSATRVHRDEVAQRATTAMGAEAMTIGHHVFLSAGAAADERLMGHELSHVDKNLKGVRETGHNNGAGVSVTDPGQSSERAAEADGHAYASGMTTAPSATVHRSTVSTAGGPVQRMLQDGEDGPGWGRVALEEKPPGSSEEDHIAGLAADSEEEVLLKRGVTPTQKKYMVQEFMRHSFVSFSKMLQVPDENATAPDPEHIHSYTSGHRTDDSAKLVEFSSNPAIASIFGSEARFGYVITVKIKRKYLGKGSSGSEKGWIAQQGAPFSIVAVEEKDSVKGGDAVPLTDAEFREVVKKEEMAEFLLNFANPDFMKEHMTKFAGAERLAEVKRITEMKKKFQD
ncbi:DUF4157 domain-containing protein [Streptomyces sp. VNUA24]|uniref:eCIS core domain-containing protein n=1 Tax=Streptomyces sp. VNUA24 TaxID=3031131 RepID=UPI0023B85C57|nr:DUF4157 domain-containing protein [Streptomyces sp. VNUA24]WEH13449.1 DUF4157 domain-containing protein [Streptomyces sp. VNUA24]